MIVRLILFVWSFVLDLAAVSRLTEDEKFLGILLLRLQLRIVERKQKRGPAIPRWQKVTLAALAMRLKDKTTHAREQLAESIILFKPNTVLGWHRASLPARGVPRSYSDPQRAPLRRVLIHYLTRWSTA